MVAARMCVDENAAEAASCNTRSAVVRKPTHTGGSAFARGLLWLNHHHHGLWCQKGINPHATHGRREFKALQCALTGHATACETRVKNTTTTTTTRAPTVKPLLSLRCFFFVLVSTGQPWQTWPHEGASSARRRRDRQLRACHRHVRTTVAMDLHHSAQRPKNRVVKEPRRRSCP